MEPVKLLERAATGAAHALRHPISSAAYAAGMARGLAGAVVHGAVVRGHDPEAGKAHVPEQRTRPAAVPDPAPQAAADDVPPPEPTPLGESFATEPKATSRESAHGGRGNDAEIDDWAAEAQEELDVETPVGTTGADAGDNPDTAEADLQQPGTEPLLDPATAKAIRSESEMMRRDAERDPE